MNMLFIWRLINKSLQDINKKHKLPEELTPLITNTNPLNKMANSWYISFILLVFPIFCNAQTKKLCITVDDLPVVSYGISQAGYKLTITKQIVDTLKKHRIPAIGYVNEQKLYDGEAIDSSQVKLIAYWLAGGMELGNHTYSHMNYHRVSFPDFTEDIRRGEKITRVLSQKYGTDLKFFRHPYLKAGETKERADSLQYFLAREGYKEAPVTIDSEDYIFAAAYSKAYEKNDDTRMKEIGEAYLSFTKQKLAYYENLTSELFQREISHILLLHANKLNADYLADLINLFKTEGYEFVSQGEALEDAAYREPVTSFGDWGISWIERWALSKHIGKDLLRENPKPPVGILNPK